MVSIEAVVYGHGVEAKIAQVFRQVGRPCAKLEDYRPRLFPVNNGVFSLDGVTDECDNGVRLRDKSRVLASRMLFEASFGCAHVESAVAAKPRSVASDSIRARLDLVVEAKFVSFVILNGLAHHEVRDSNARVLLPAFSPFSSSMLAFALGAAFPACTSGGARSVARRKGPRHWDSGGCERQKTHEGLCAIGSFGEGGIERPVSAHFPPYTISGQRGHSREERNIGSSELLQGDRLESWQWQLGKVAHE